MLTKLEIYLLGVVLLAALILIPACATVGEKTLLAGTTGLIRFSAEDVDAAITIAQQAQDPVAEACFRAIRKHTDQEIDPIIKGIVSAYAAARAKVREARAGLAADVHVACSPLIVDAATFSSSFGARLIRP